MTVLNKFPTTHSNKEVIKEANLEEGDGNLG